MLLEKPQSEAVEMVLTDCYDAGRNAVIKALYDFQKEKPFKGITSFFEWYSENEDAYKMQFKVSDK